jgi:hypothetical protein
MAVAAVAPDLAFDVQQSPPDLPPLVRALMAKIEVEADQACFPTIRGAGRRG